ncbi:MAG: hypothetical protein M1285_02475 [Candidatus Thermoplasmatota archaeon]|jgi:hypothetical protein|nr:hypothetical protein [Candidatus Thermoplasmatota archaeon]
MQGDLIKSKKDKYKAIKAALKKLIEEGDVVKVNIRGEPWKLKDEEPWYHFRTSRANQELPDDYFTEQFKKMVEQDKLIIKLYNQSFNTTLHQINIITFKWSLETYTISKEIIFLALLMLCMG